MAVNSADFFFEIWNEDWGRTPKYVVNEKRRVRRHLFVIWWGSIKRDKEKRHGLLEIFWAETAFPEMVKRKKQEIFAELALVHQGNFRVRFHLQKYKEECLLLKHNAFFFLKKCVSCVVKWQKKLIGFKLKMMNCHLSLTWVQWSSRWSNDIYAARAGYNITTSFGNEERN